MLEENRLYEFCSKLFVLIFPFYVRISGSVIIFKYLTLFMVLGFFKAQQSKTGTVSIRRCQRGNIPIPPVGKS
jgi:hypothetical protein